MPHLLAEQDSPALQQLPMRAAKHRVAVSYLLVLYPKEEPIKADWNREKEKTSLMCAAGIEL